MTDRIHSITLVLDKDIRIDDAESLIVAAGQLKGVIGVTPNISDSDSHFAYVRARNDLLTKLYEVFKS